MIIGSGDIAKALESVDRDDLVFFASGVSNSAETRLTEFGRELDLLLEQDPEKHLVYFSSLSVFYSVAPYAVHKMTMEEQVKEHFPRHTIVRIGNISFGKNPHTIINFMRSQYAKGEKLRIEDTYRYVVTKDELLYWIGMIPPWSCEMNVPGTRMTIQEIVDKYVLA